MQRKGKAGHFVGSIVNITEQAMPTGVQKYMIIDGQQRITVLYLLLHYIKFKTNNDTLEICKYINGTYAKFDCAMKYYFDEDRMESDGKKDEILESDLLDQNDNEKNEKQN